MTFTIHTLTRDDLKRHIEQYILLLHGNLSNEYWSFVHFLMDFPRKWELSLYAQDELKNIVGFLIASEKEKSVHIHKVVVDVGVQDKGVGTEMINRLLALTNEDITLSVPLNSAPSISFFKKKGFDVTNKTDKLCTMMFPRTA